MLQLVYISTARGAPQLADILATSQRNNGRDGITGLLYYDGMRFLQALEGPAERAEAAFARIKQDARHRSVVLLSRRDVNGREFGPWEMASRRPGDGGEQFVARVSPLLADASPSIRGTFEGFMKVERAA